MADQVITVSGGQGEGETGGGGEETGGDVEG